MADDEGSRFPLLLFPQPEKAERAKKQGGPGGIRFPSHKRQIESLTPQLRRLQKAFERRRLELREDLAGVEPELALVFETLGSVPRFLKAVKLISGLEWLAELEEDVEADKDFYLEKKPDKALPGSLYLVMSDQRAVAEMLSLWRRYRKAPKQKFERGFTPWRTLFEQLKEVRPWGPEDRLRETGLLEDWDARLRFGEETVRTEIELWFRRRWADREREAAEVRTVLGRAGGRLLGQCVIEEIAYHGLLAELPAATAAAITANEEVALVKCEEVMFFRPVGQVLAVPTADEPAVESAPRPAPAEGLRRPFVALLDGLPLERHDLLRDRLVIDDPDGWAAVIPAGHRNHGTAMASLILHGDLGSTEAPLNSPVHVRPILKPATSAIVSPPPELIPEEVLQVDLVHRAVRRFFEGEGDEPATAPSVQVLNFSVGDSSRPFDRFTSPMARLLDWLAWKYKLLVVVSAGNHAAIPLELSCAPQELSDLDAATLQKQTWRTLARSKHLRRLLSPAEAVNALTVGGEHSDAAGTYDPGFRIDLFGSSDGATRLPSPITAFGPGVGRALKPEVLFPAGRQLFEERLATGNGNLSLRVVTATGRPPGQLAASPGGATEGTTAVRYLCGTSNAAALASRTATVLCERLPFLLEGYGEDDLPERKYLAPLLKAFLVHGARWGDARYALEESLEWSDKPRQQRRRPVLGQFLGFGFGEQQRVLECTEQRVTLVGWGELEKEEGHVYRIPLPPSLSGKKVWKRVVVTLAWLTPLNCTDRRYRRAQLWFTPKQKGEYDLEQMLGVSRCDADYHAAARGTVQHEVFEGEEASAFVEEDQLVLKVNCREHAGRLEDTVPYGLLLSLEVAPELELPVYQEVRARVRQKVRVGA